MVRFAVAVLLVNGLSAQSPLMPASNLTLDTTANAGHFVFSYVDIPPGVRVTFTGPNPVQIECLGDARIDGQLDVDASGSTNGPGAVTLGAGSPGWAGRGWP